MYGTNVVSTGLTFGKVLTGISKGLSIANQVIPLYQQAKPMISNARKILSVIKKMNKDSNNNVINGVAHEANSVNEDTKKALQLQSRTSPNNTSNPVFFL